MCVRACVRVCVPCVRACVHDCVRVRDMKVCTVVDSTSDDVSVVFDLLID